MATDLITEAELLDALAAATHGSGPTNARTVAELMKDTGFGELKVRRALALCKAGGRLVVHRVTREALDGRASTVPAYTILPAK